MTADAVDVRGVMDAIALCNDDKCSVAKQEIREGGTRMHFSLDDSPDCLTVELTTEKVRRKEDEGVLVTVERREPTT